MSIRNDRTPRWMFLPGRERAARAGWRSPFRKSIASKILVALGTVLILSIAATFGLDTRLTRSELGRQSQEALDDDLRALRVVLASEQAELMIRLEDTSRAIAFLEPVSAADVTDLGDELDRVRHDLRLDAVALFDDGGDVIAASGVPLAPLTQRAAARVTTSRPALLLHTAAGGYVHAPIVPVRVEDRVFLLTGGSRFDDTAAYRMQELVGDPTVLLADGQVVGASAAGMADLPGVEIGSVGHSEVTVAGQDMLVGFVPVVPEGEWEPEGLVGVARPHPFAALDAALTRNRLLGAGLLSLLVVLLGWLLFLRLSRPLFRLADTARRLEQGELGTPFVADSDDEIGELGRTLEAMRRSLATQLAVIESQATELRDSARRIVGAQDAERRRLAHDLHDGLQRRLVVLRMRVGEFGARTPSDLGAARALARDLAREIDEVIADVRSVSYAIYPSILRDRGLQKAVRSLARRCPVPLTATFSPEPLPRLPLAVEENAYLLLSEAVTNAMKHAQASRIEADVRVHDDMLTVTVADDGVGLDPADATIHDGLVHMRDRVAAVGGRLDIDGHLGKGTRVTAVIPSG